MGVTPARPDLPADPSAAGDRPAEADLAPHDLDAGTPRHAHPGDSGSGITAVLGVDEQAVPRPHVVVRDLDEIVVRPDQDFQVVVTQKVMDQIRAHGESEPALEVCGVLVGTVYEKAEVSFAYIDAIVRGENTNGRSTQVTFTAETWEHIHRQMDELHPDKRIVGWYHTHPGFGIFLSEMDLFIQKHFFNAPWQSALVYDPKTGERGLFSWRTGQTKRVDFAIDDGSGADILPGPIRGGEAVTAHEDPAPPIMAGAVLEMTDRIQALERRHSWTLAGLALLALIALLSPLAVVFGLRFFEPKEKKQPAIDPLLLLPYEDPANAAAGGVPPGYKGAKGSIDVPLRSRDEP